MMLSMQDNDDVKAVSQNGYASSNSEGESETQAVLISERVQAVDKRVRYGLAKIGAEGTADELRDFYDQNAAEYEEIRGLVRSDMGRQCLADALSRVVPDKNARLLDCAAGTGGGAEFMLKAGFKYIDALEPSRGMLDIAERKNIYTRVFCDAFQTDKQVDIENETYDALFFSCAFFPGHLGLQHIPEMIRILKPGGTMVFNVPDKYLLGADDFKDGKLDSALQSFVKNGRFESVVIERGPYRFGEDSNIYTIKLPMKSVQK